MDKLDNITSKVEASSELKSSSLWRDAWIRLSKNRLAIAGLIVLLTLIMISLLTPIIAPYGYEEQNLAIGATAPSEEHLLGTDIFGRDITDYKNRLLIYIYSDGKIEKKINLK